MVKREWVVVLKVFRYIFILFGIIAIIICYFMFNYKFYNVSSNSMSPTIKSGDLVIVKNKNNYNVDDIIVFNADLNSIVTHRIINISDSTIITKGDNNYANDLPITKDKIIGKVVKIIPVINYPLVRHAIILLTIFGPVLLTISIVVNIIICIIIKKINKVQ